MRFNFSDYNDASHFQNSSDIEKILRSFIFRSAPMTISGEEEAGTGR